MSLLKANGGGLGGAGAPGGALGSFYSHSIDQSLRFNDNDSAYLSHTPGSAGSLTTWTWSGWVKRGNLIDGAFFSAGSLNQILFITDRLYYEHVGNGNYYLISTNKLRDTSAWYHVVFVWDTTNTTSTDRMRIYINGDRVTAFDSQSYPVLNEPSVFNTATTHEIGHRINPANYYLDAYLAEINFIDGQALDGSSFGETKDGVWIPKAYSGSYGDNGFRLTFQGTGTATTTAGNTAQINIGDDQSGEGNNWAVSGLAATDVVPDSPTNNFCTINNVDSNLTLSEGNLKALGVSGTYFNLKGSFNFDVALSDGWYFEFMSINGSVNEGSVGIAPSSYLISNIYSATLINDTKTYNPDGSINISTSFAGSTWANGDIIGVAVKNGKIYYSKNGVFQASADPVNETNPATTGLTGFYAPFMYSATSSAGGVFNFGQDSSFAGTKTSGSANAADGNGIGDFYYAPPSGFLALASSNLPEPEIIDGSENFNTVLWTGDGSQTRSLTGVNFQPDFSWLKIRSGTTQDHQLYDSVRGAGSGKNLSSNTTAVEGTVNSYPDGDYGFVSSFDADGFSVNDGAVATNGGYVNYSGRTYAAWNWKAGGATPTKTYKVVVDNDGANKYRFRNSANNATFATYAPTIELQEGGTYVFDWSDDGTNGAVSAQGHPIRFSTTSDGTHGSGSEYTTGVVKDDSAYTTTITVASGAPTLYYYCQNHSGMGGQVNTNDTFGSSHFDGSILSTVSVNPKAGFSIVSYTGTGSAVTVAHGLSAAPELILSKNRDDADGWLVYHASRGASAYLVLNDTGVGETSVSYPWNGTAPTSSVFSTNSAGSVSSEAYISYCFHSVEGYSKLGSYTGNGNADGTFVFTGHRPSFLLIKRTDATGTNWWIFDNKRSTFNVVNDGIITNGSDAEFGDNSSLLIDFLSNGFKVRNTYGDLNTSGANHIFLSFAESPFKFSNAR